MFIKRTLFLEESEERKLPYIPGSPIRARCQTCKADTDHVVLEAIGMQIRLVRCQKCTAEGPFHAPLVKPKVAPEVKKKKTRTTRRRAATPEAQFKQLLEGRDLSSAMPYNVKLALSSGDIIDHTNFGLGVVTEIVGPTKAKIFFESGERVMICNRE